MYSSMICITKYILEVPLLTRRDTLILLNNIHRAKLLGFLTFAKY